MAALRPHERRNSHLVKHRESGSVESSATVGIHLSHPSPLGYGVAIEDGWENSESQDHGEESRMLSPESYQLGLPAHIQPFIAVARAPLLTEEL